MESAMREVLRRGAMTALAAVWLAGTACNVLDEYKRKDIPVGPALPSADTIPPAVRISTPAGADSLHATPVNGAAYAVGIQAHDDGGIASVVLFLDTTPVDTLAVQPYSYAWNTTPCVEGSLHMLRARAVDASGNAAWSEPVYAVVYNAGPRITLSAPADGAWLGGDVELACEVAQSGMQIERVDFMGNGRLLGSAQSAPFRYRWSSAADPPGSYRLNAIALASNGQSGWSPVITVQVNNFPPRVKCLFPHDGQLMASQSVVPLRAVAWDTVEQSVGDSIVWSSDGDGELGHGASITIGWPGTLSLGDHRIVARAANAWGLVGADTIRITVESNGSVSFCNNLMPGFLWQTCFPCHNPWNEEGEYTRSQFSVNTWWDVVIKGGRHQQEEGRLTVYGCSPESSLIIQKVTATSTNPPPVGDPMPPPASGRARLTDAQVNQLRTWIQEGAAPDEMMEYGCMKK